MCPNQAYLHLLKAELPTFLAEIENEGKIIRLAIYNAGTDVYEGDGLGRLGLTEEGILERDMFVINMLRYRNIPTVMVLGGGYTPQSYQFVVNSIQQILQENYPEVR